MAQLAATATAGGEGAGRAPRLFYVNTGADDRPRRGAEYPLVHSSDLTIRDRPIAAGPWRSLILDLHNLYSGDLPDLGTNEGILTLSIETRLPKDVGIPVLAKKVIKFRVRDFEYASGFESAPGFEGILFTESVNLTFGLVELDGRFADAFTKITKVVDDSGLGRIDIAKGLPYLDVGTKLATGLVGAFGTNNHDVLWAQTPKLAIDPVAGSAYLRDGIYVLADRHGITADSSLTYKDGEVRLDDGQLRTSHLVFGCQITTAQAPK